MTPRRINLALKSLAAALVVCAAASFATALFLPLDDESAIESASTRTTPTTHPASGRSLESFASAWTAPLRQSLDELPPSPDRPTLASESVNPGATSTGPVALVGTIGESLAMLRTSDGLISLKAVGESAGGAEVLAIRAFEVDVQLNGQRTTLRKPTGAPLTPSVEEQVQGASELDNPQ